ncbi:MAG: XTP/dITP diphosphatase [Limnochordia bacterium]
MLEIVLASRNKHKVSELSSLLVGVAEVRSLLEFPGIPEIKETGTTFLENALLKAKTVADFTGRATLADDSGLEVEALDGAPGVYSARFAGPAATDADNRARLLEQLQGVPNDKRQARFVCAIAIVKPDNSIWTTVGQHEGMILESPRGTLGFGYDPLFFSYELGATFAEVPAETKNKVSHRARAMAEVYKHLGRLT